jgi:Skp family chaperone for outer membrane proteins
MRSNPAALLAVLALLALSGVEGAASPALAQQNAVPKPPADPAQAAFKLGVVNLKTCFEREKYERIKEVDEDLKKKAEEFKKRLEDIQKKLVTLKEQIEQLPRESALRAERLRDFKRAETDLKFEQEFGRAMYLDFYNDRKIEVYNHIRKAVDVVGKAGNYDLVLRVDSPMLEESDPESPTQRINSRVVLFHNQGVDITEEVLKILNAEYAKEKAAKGGGK